MQDISSKTGRSYYHSSSFKMALFFTVLLGFGVGIMGYFGYYFSKGHFIESTEAVLQTDMMWLGEITDPEILKTTVDAHAQQDKRAYLLLDAQGQKIAGDLDIMPNDVALLAEGTITFKAGAEHNTYAARIRTFDDGRKLLAGIDITEDAADFTLMRNLSVLTILCMALVIIVSFIISTFVVSRTNRIARTAQAIMDTGDMTQRVAIDSKWDDLSYLAEVINAFLTRNEHLLRGIKQVSDNVAHDLRTPLTRLRNNLEAMRRSVTDKDAIAAKYDELLHEADHLLNTFAALMRIAHVETGKQRHNFKAVEVHTLLSDVIELYEPLAEDKRIKLTLAAAPATMKGDRDLLFQAVANLIDNAIKFTPPEGRISVGLTLEGKALRISVTDSGTGITDADKPRVFERFYRANASRNTPGNGLGLSLVGAVVDLHQGKITLSDAAPGLVVTLVFPV